MGRTVQCRHCWHLVDMDDGEFVRYCCHCGGWYAPQEWRLLSPKPAAHGPYGATSYPNGELSFTWLMSDEQVVAMGFERVKEGE